MIEKFTNCFKKTFCISDETEENLRRMSLFGTSYTFSLAGGKQFKTFIGGIISIFIRIFSLIFFIYLIYNYIVSSMIGEVIRVESIEQKGTYDISDTLKLIFWFTKLEPGKQPEYLKPEEFKKYLVVAPFCMNEIEDKETGQKPFVREMDIVECDKSGDKTIEKLLSETTVSSLKKIPYKMCLKSGKKHVGVIDVKKKNELNKLNYIGLIIQHCKKTQDTPDCDEEARKTTKFYIHHMQSQRIVNIAESGRSALFWLKNKKDVLEDKLDVGFSSRYIRQENEGRRITEFHHYAEVKAELSFESLARLIRKIPFAKYVLKLIYDHEGPFVGLEIVDNTVVEHEEAWGGMVIGLNMFNKVIKMSIKYFSVIDFLSQVCLTFLRKFF